MKTKGKFMRSQINWWGMLLAGVFLLPAAVFATCSTNQETGCVECGPHWSAWTIICPSQTNCGSLSLPIYEPWSDAPIMPTNISLPSYDVGTMTRTGIFDCSTNITNDIVYITFIPSGGVIWTNFSSPYTNFPNEVTNTFSAQAYVNFTSSEPSACASPGLVQIGSCAASSPNVKASTSSGVFNIISTQVWNSLGIKHQCVMNSPTNKWRKTIGVGEDVALLANGLPSDANVTWTCTDGTFGQPSQPNGTSIVWTAPNYAANGSENCTITANYNSSTIGSGPITLVLTVLNPQVINMSFLYGEHDYNTATIGMLTGIYVGPDTVNFQAVQVQELAVYPSGPFEGQQVKFNGSGVYALSSYDVHGTTVPAQCSSQVVVGLGTYCSGSTDESKVAGQGTYDPSNGSGQTICDIPCQWNCNNTGWVDFGAYEDEVGVSSGSPNNNLTISKCIANYSCLVSSPSLSLPPH